MTFHMTNFSLYKQTGKVWYSPPIYYEGYKLCLAVYANGKGTGAGTHVSGELLQMRAEWEKQEHDKYYEIHDEEMNITIQMMTQCKEPMLQDKQFTLKHHLCSACFNCLPLREDVRICQSFSTPFSENKFIDYRVAEQFTVLNDTNVLKISYNEVFVAI